MSEDTPLDFAGQAFYIGIDVHRNSWVVTIRSSGLELRTISMGANAQQLYEYMHKSYPGGSYYSVYEAGFSGYMAHRELQCQGISNMVVHAADVPSSEKERYSKSDRVDSRKLAKALEQQQLQGIYIPTQQAQQLRGLVRLRQTLAQEQARVKTRIKSLLYFEGLAAIIPSNHRGHWSARFVEDIRQQQQKMSAAGAQTLEILLETLVFYRQKIAQTVQWLRSYTRQQQQMAADIQLLQSVPGIGFVAAMICYSELVDISRFQRYEQLCSYAGLIPTLSASAERQKVGELTPRCNARLRRLLIEASWVAVRSDPAMLAAYKKLLVRMKPQQAIIRIARKLLRRLRCVLLKRLPYRMAVA